MARTSEPEAPVDAPKKEWVAPELEVLQVSESELHLLVAADGGTGHS